MSLQPLPPTLRHGEGIDDAPPPPPGYRPNVGLCLLNSQRQVRFLPFPSLLSLSLSYVLTSSRYIPCAFWHPILAIDASYIMASSFGLARLGIVHTSGIDGVTWLHLTLYQHLRWKALIIRIWLSVPKCIADSVWMHFCSSAFNIATSRAAYQSKV